MLNVHTLPIIWGCIMAFVIFAYVTLDGFDLGVGILFGVEPMREDRDVMVNSIAPVWDGNETWLVLGGSGLYGAFPVAYSVILPSVYLLVITMLMGLILRGVSFEFRFRATTERQRHLWDYGFFGGSVVAAFCQGVILGGVLQGTRIAHQQFAGGTFDWLSGFSIFTGIAVVLGYALLGATWLVWRTEGELQRRVRRHAKVLGIVMLALILVVSLWTPTLDPSFAHRWFSFPGIFITGLAPLAVIALGYAFFRTLARDTEAHHDKTPFLCALGMFFVSFLGLGYSLYPNIVPPTLTIWQAASPVSSQIFLLVGAVVMIPIIIGYNIFAYSIFHGKVEAGAHYH
ncbi:cytochrome d ubiquinol oxidase subunit II [Acidiphilium sp. AL]|uniref:cytochrome d ubiquinol oxidase subunit II n=1 Tax=Acidiphilium sp. AL TaxID=2871704 RepID=UPI0021CB98CE|nr:cytochrome d ubiquinol oxidase subunit II [Acidiphilium sp. AL]MCU4159187.1 cytochrome d ubiquinol oxidase subunit II [Acidiphilium sp. AL]